jgi:hypothetical protein
VWAVRIVVDPPVFDAVSGVSIAGEEPLVEAFVAQARGPKSRAASLDPAGARI